MRAAAIFVVIAAFAIAACGGPAAPAPTGAPPATVASTVAAPPSEVTVTWDGVIYPLSYFQCASKIWDDQVAEWSALTYAQRDQYGGAEQYFRAKGYLTTPKAVLDSRPPQCA